MDSPLELYDRRLLALRRERAARMPADGRFVQSLIDEELQERIGFVRRAFHHALVVGAGPSSIGGWLATRGASVLAIDSAQTFVAAHDGGPVDPDWLFECAEVREKAPFDLIVVPGGMDLVNDLPGLLIQCRNLLSPDSMIIGALIGAGSLPVLRRLFATAEDRLGRAAAPRLHPQIDVRAAGDLMARAGFKQPIADGFGIDVRYPDWRGLVRDIRAHGGANALLARNLGFLGGAFVSALDDAFLLLAEADGKVRERVELIMMTGWSPPA